MDAAAKKQSGAKRLAIIGCGSSGLIMLKYALDELTGWEIVCFEKSDRITGVWGNPYDGFVSTSTKFTTQFCCFPERDACVDEDGGESRVEFFRNGEYGEYLNRFADAFGLRDHIKMGHLVTKMQRDEHNSGWQISFRRTAATTENETEVEHFDAVVICTGLTAKSKELNAPVPILSPQELNGCDGVSTIRNERIVVFGGGESAVDYAARLSRDELQNEVFLSLRTGIRVSPRYHPIRGVPSDFLRNRLMLSVHPVLRNWIGQRFVEARMLHQERFERWFPAKHSQASNIEHSIQSLRKQWAHRLTKGAKDELFNMFHNKSDDFLEGVARGRIRIVGEPVDNTMTHFYEFDSAKEVEVSPTKVIPAVGYHSTLSEVTGGKCSLKDFYLGFIHTQYPDLFLVGFARPVIGNIPSISEIQAIFIARLLSGRVTRPNDIENRHSAVQKENAQRFAKVDLETIYPVEMFPYCDYLAKEMEIYPSIKRVGSLRDWWKMQLMPATTGHYLFDESHSDQREVFCKAPVYMPTLLIVLLVLLKPVDWTFRGMRRLWRPGRSHLPS